MVKSCVTISLVPSLCGGPWVYWEEPEISIPKAKAAGFDAVELFTASADAVDSDMLARLLDEHDMKLAAVGTGAGKVLHGLHLVSGDANVRQKARDFISGMIAFGARFGAAAIVGSMQGCVEDGVEREQALAWLTEGLGELGQKAAGCGVNLILEPLNRYETNLINRLGEGVEVIKSAKCENMFLLADLFHMNIEEESFAGTIREVGKYIGYVHFVDSNRRAAGMGHIDLAEVARALKEISYDGYVSAEALAYPDSDKAAAQTIAAFKKVFV
ncbi:MAG: TIM barrel protein [Planctomycetota bacterium]|jgi:sugar phosphate isomerase/epimerase